VGVLNRKKKWKVNLFSQFAIKAPGKNKMHSEEQARKVSKIFPTNEIVRNKICSVDLLNCHEWRKVGCVVENKLEFRQ
jgi:hypothetical protein